jgi:hypothetical protein
MAVLPTGIGSAVAGGYQIERSLRFNSADSAYLNRTPASAGNRRTFTFNAWVKRSTLGTVQQIIGQGAGVAGGGFCIYFNSNDTIRVYSGSNDYLITNAVFRDPSAWYMITLLVDTTQATAANRVRLFVNGVEQTYSATNYPAQNTDTTFNQALEHRISGNTSATYILNSYLTEVNFIDGQALTPSDFGETDSNTGVWKPKAYTGTYGTNGFYLKFADNSNTTAATLGKDSSGNGNNWTPNNFSVTAGVGNDSLVDTPTSYGTDTGVGGEVRGNYCTMNPLTVPTLPTLANGNLDVSVSATGVKIAQGTFQFPSSGKWYYECTFNNASSGVNGMFIGITSPTRGPNVTRSTAGAYFFYAASSGLLNSNGTDIVTGLSAISANEVFKLAVDIDNSKVWIGRGSTWYNSSGGTTGDPAAGTNPTFSISAIGLTPMSGFDASSVSLSMNFGQRSFNTTAPSGFKALCTQNLPTPTIGATSTTQAGKYFNVRLYSGNGNTGQTITGVGFQPDFTWLKNRNMGGGYFHLLYDAVRGAGYNLRSDSTAAETNRTAVFSAFTSDGFTFPAGQGNTIENDSAGTYASWNWKANGAGSSNTAGTITSTVSANNDSGFSIVTYTGNSTSSQTVGHGCKVGGVATAPSMVIVKDRSASTTNDWRVYHRDLTGGNNELRLNTTAAQATDATTFSSAPSATVLNYGNNTAVNGSSRTYVAYCFANVDGYSKAFSYASNNSADNAFVYLGFRPEWIMIKSASTGGTNYDWLIYDTLRMTYNYIANTDIRANLTITEGGTARNPAIDILSNGFKVRSSAGEIGSSTLYVGMAFAETPFKYSLAR